MSGRQVQFAFIRRVAAPLLVVAVIPVTSVNDLSAQQQPVSLVKGQVYTLKLPMAVLNYDGARAGWSSVSSVYVAEVSGTPSALQVAGKEDWQVSGFPSLLEVKFEKTKAQKTFTDLEFRSTVAVGIDVKLRFPPGFATRDAIGDLVLAGPSSSEAAQSYLKQSYSALEEKFFAGPLSSLPPDKKRLLTVYAHTTAGGISLSSETYKGNVYMVVDLGRDTSVYNDVKFTQSTRLAHVMNDRLLKLLKAFAKPVEDAPQLFGLKLEFRVPHRSFLDTSALTVDDVLQFYAPAELIKKFSEADITNQQFVDGCVAILNGDRVQVPLSGPSRP